VEQGYQAVQHQENDEEDPEEIVFEDDGTEEHPQLYDGVFLEVNADGDIIFPSEVEAVPEPDVVEGEELEQNAAGNDPDDSGDDSSSSEDGTGRKMEDPYHSPLHSTFCLRSSCYQRCREESTMVYQQHIPRSLRRHGLPIRPQQS
jgi:hypothetical protein